MNSFNRLVEIFSEFPGIGPRQAKRFVYFLLTQPPNLTGEFVRALENLKANTLTCTSCFRIFSRNAGGLSVCSICLDKNRDASLLAVVSRDSDLESLEKSGSFDGFYFVLGGIVPILETEPERKVRSRELVQQVEKKIENGLKEIILAMSANADGENTANYINELLSPYKTQGLKVSLLGRGLSTGIELEYSDAETLRNALGNRR